MMIAFTALPAAPPGFFVACPPCGAIANGLGWGGESGYGIFCWLVFTTLCIRGQYLGSNGQEDPSVMTAWRFARWRKATYGNVRLLGRCWRRRSWSPRHHHPRACWAGGDDSHAENAPKHPVPQQGWKARIIPGLGRALRPEMAAWDGSRLPGAFGAFAQAARRLACALLWAARGWTSVSHRAGRGWWWWAAMLAWGSKATRRLAQDPPRPIPDAAGLWSWRVPARGKPSRRKPSKMG